MAPRQVTRRTALALAAGAIGGALLEGFGHGSAAGGGPLGPAGFSRGVNLTVWLQLSGEETYTAEDLAELRRLGFDHVRLPFDGYTLAWRLGGESGGGLPLGRIGDLDAAVGSILGAGLNLILDFHPGPETIGVLKTPEGERGLIELWCFLAARYARQGEGRIVYELMNEPQRVYGTDADDWYRVQEHLISTIRASSSDWILSSGVWDRVNRLRTVRPFADPRIVYGIDLYDPLEFTHMGAGWDDAQRSGRADLRNLRYPASETDRHAAFVAPEGNRLLVMNLAHRYMAEGWNADQLRARVAIAADWSRSHGLPLHCSEFGVMRTHVDTDSRHRWLRDARTALEETGIGWTVWDLVCTFGIVETIDPNVADSKPAQTGRFCPPRRDGRIIIEPGARQALGLG